MLRCISFVGVVFILLYGSSVQSAIVIADGRSVIGKDVVLARKNALNDALRNAVIKVGGRVESVTGVKNGLLVNDNVRLSTSGQVRDVEILRDSQDGDFYIITIRADVDADTGSCIKAGGRIYNKSVLFTAFPREIPESSTVGRLFNVDTDFPKELSRRLYPSYNTVNQLATGVQLSSDNTFLSDSSPVYSAVQKYAEQYQVQFIVSGSIVDMSMVDPSGYFNQTWFGGVGRKLKGLVGGSDNDDIRERLFSFRLMLFDGLSGDYIFDKTYSRIGVWDAKYTESTGFASPRYWKTGYGKVSSELIDEAITDLGQKLNCQPFMTALTVSESEQAVRLMAGANSGVKVGDSFEVYSLDPTNSAGLVATGLASQHGGLRKTEGTLTITQTYPTYSIGDTSVELKSTGKYSAVFW